MWDPLLRLVIGALVLAALTWLLWPGSGLAARVRRGRSHRRRVLREDALKYLFKAEKDEGWPTLEGMAGVLGIDTDAASAVLGDLISVGLAQRQDRGPSLTEAGRDYALHVIRAHRLWERYLADHTGFGEVEWHREADVKEHDLTREEVARLQESLGHPTHDPHGDPIPNTTDEAVSAEGWTLADAPLRRPLRILHVEDEPEALYVQVLAHDLHPGTVVHLEERTPTAVTFWANGREGLLAPLVAASVLVAVAEAPAARPTEPRRTLRDLAIGEEAVLTEIAPSVRGLERRRLLDLGFLPGTPVTAEMASAGGDPIAYRVRGSLVALRHHQAAQIYVTAGAGAALPAT